MSHKLTENLTLYFNGDRVKIDDCGQYHMATVIRDDRLECSARFEQAPGTKIWVLLDTFDNPIQIHPDEIVADGFFGIYL